MAHFLAVMLRRQVLLAFVYSNFRRCEIQRRCSSRKAGAVRDHSEERWIDLYQRQLHSLRQHLQLSYEC